MDLKISESRGGRKEFEEKGIYPVNLIFSSEKHNGKWQCSYQGMPQRGSLDINGRIIFNYISHSSYFEIQEIKEDGQLSNWVEVEISTVWCD